MEITGKAKELYDLLYTKEFDIEKLKTALATGEYSGADVDLAGYMYVDDLVGNMMDENWVYHYGEIGEILPGYESSHVYEAVKVLLDYGLNPNTIFTEEHGTTKEQFNIMWNFDMYVMDIKQ